ncbi:MAG: hypothetical protein F6J92_42135, partial [Symploca sp. SIO1A3]|nr:hypothetical protein [Symploca sp. SIO1A3]
MINYTPNPGIPETREGTIAELKRLGLPAIPVAPKQKRGGFSGKNPSYLDQSGKAHHCKHGQYHEELPSDRDDRKHFEHPNTGVGTLGGHGGHVFIDFDSKNYESEQACKADVERLIVKYGLERTRIFKTGAEGWRIVVKSKQKPWFTNFATSPNGKHVGEALGKGRFTVLPPSVH